MYALRVRPHVVTQHAAVMAATSTPLPSTGDSSPDKAPLQLAFFSKMDPIEHSSSRAEFIRAIADPKSAASQSLRQFTPSELAHLRMGHLHNDAFPRLLGLVPSTDWISAGAKGPTVPCEGCLLGKAHRTRMPSVATTRAKEPLELVHSDVCGPFRTPSMGGFLYYVLFVDDCTRMVIAYPIAKKSDVLDRFLTFKAWAEAKTGKRLRAFRTDGGGEYFSHAFSEHLRTSGVARQKTPPYTPEHNGVAERANRTLMEAVRALLIHARLHKRFWALALHTAVYLRNRSPTSAVEGMTPFEAFTGQRPSLDHLHVFGCLAYVHVPDVKRGKLDPKSRPCTFVGYSTESKAYLFWDPAKKTVITSRDATFVENLTGDFQPIPSFGETEVDQQTTTRGDSTPLISDVGRDGIKNSIRDEKPNVGPVRLSPPSVPSSTPSAPRPPAPSFLGHVRQLLQEQKADADAASSTSRIPLSARPRVNSRVRAPSAPLAMNLRSRATQSRPSEQPGQIEVEADHSRLTAPLPAPLATSTAPPSMTSFSSFIEQLQPPSPSLSSTAFPSGTHALHTNSVATAAANDDPSTFSEAMNRNDQDKWEAAMKDEYDSIQSAGTWTLVALPAGRHAIGCKWVFKLKRKADGTIDRYKARLVAKGYAQKAGVDYDETFAPVAKFSAIRALLSMAAYYDFEIHQMDVKTAFLNGDLDHVIYMTQPEGFAVAGQEQLVCKLGKSLYGLKQAGRAWYEKIDEAFQCLGFTPLKSDPCIYALNRGSVVVFIALYVDDLLLISNSVSALTKLKADLTRLFSMKDLGDAEYVLGIQIERNRTSRTLSISQGEYIRNVLERFGMADCKPVATPLETSSKLTKADCPPPGSPTDAAFTRLYQSAVGAIMYAMLGTRPDIAYAVTALSQFNSNPGQPHWSAVKHVLRYLRGTIGYKLTYGPDAAVGGFTSPKVGPLTSSSLPLYGYSDSDWGSDPDDRRSVTGYVFMLGGGAVSWQARKQTTVALSSVEAEYMAATQATKEAMWWRSVLVELGHHVNGPTVIHSDSQGSIALTRNPQHHARSKHIDIRHHFVREQVAVGTVTLQYIPTEDMLADVLTKSIPRDKHARLVVAMGLHSSPSAVGVLERAE
jgi:transposase InsO family protein